MKTYNTNLCIGGPLDGKRYIEPGDRESFHVPLLKKLELAPYPSPHDPDQVTHTVEYCTYKRMTFRTSGDQLVTFWAPDTEDYFRVLVRLLNRYESRGLFIERAKELLYNLNHWFFQGTIIGKGTAEYANDMYKFLTDLLEHLEATEKKE